MVSATCSFRPSAKSLLQAFGQWITLAQAEDIRAIMAGPGRVNGRTRMERIDAILGTSGVEVIPAGRGACSPGFAYCNAGDTYAATIIKIGRGFRIGTWGDIVERGRYA